MFAKLVHTLTGADRKAAELAATKESEFGKDISPLEAAMFGTSTDPSNGSARDATATARSVTDFTERLKHFVEAHGKLLHLSPSSAGRLSDLIERRVQEVLDATQDVINRQVLEGSFGSPQSHVGLTQLSEALTGLSRTVDPLTITARRLEEKYESLRREGPSSSDRKTRKEFEANLQTLEKAMPGLQRIRECGWLPNQIEMRADVLSATPHFGARGAQELLIKLSSSTGKELANEVVDTCRYAVKVAQSYTVLDGVGAGITMLRTAWQAGIAVKAGIHKLFNETATSVVEKLALVEQIVQSLNEDSIVDPAPPRNTVSIKSLVHNKSSKSPEELDRYERDTFRKIRPWLDDMLSDLQAFQSRMAALTPA